MKFDQLKGREFITLPGGGNVTALGARATAGNAGDWPPRRVVRAISLCVRSTMASGKPAKRVT